MKVIKYCTIIFIAFCLNSCQETQSGQIQIQNKISKVKIQDVRWDNFNLSYELLPGETSYETTIDETMQELPYSSSITFKMVANGKIVYLETKEKYQLNYNDKLLIVLSDSTEVVNQYNY